MELLEDVADGAPEAADAARARYGDLVERVTDERPDAESLGELDAYGMAATLDVAADAKQTLLEERSERDRLERLEELFASALERIQLVEKAAERSRGNGSMRS